MAHFQRQRSYSFQALHVGAWCSGDLPRVAGFARMAATDESDDGDGLRDRKTRGPRRQLQPASTQLRRMWRRIVTKNMKMATPAPPPPEIAYDLQTYQQNFDEGAAWAEPDNLCRSFSARYAIPSGAL